MEARARPVVGLLDLRASSTAMPGWPELLGEGRAPSVGFQGGCLWWCSGGAWDQDANVVLTLPRQTEASPRERLKIIDFERCRVLVAKLILCSGVVVNDGPLNCLQIQTRTRTRNRWYSTSNMFWSYDSQIGSGWQCRPEGYDRHNVAF
ncbi:hypothetical protein ACQ4PT_048706 [Festuca glaucescens]